MTSDTNRQIISLLAMLGIAVSLARLRPPLPEIAIPRQERLPTRRALAREMQLYELSLLQGSTLSWQAYTSIEHTCHEDRADSIVARACAIFEDALRHESNHRAIDRAVDLLTGDT